MFAAVAAGAKHGGFDSIVEASSQMARLAERAYVPNSANKAVYSELYAQYLAFTTSSGETATT